MQIVIDIDEKVYGLLKYFESALQLNDKKDNDDVKTALMRAVINGTPITKGHGRLIDADDLYNSLEFPTQQFASAFKQVLDDAPTIIKSDREESEGV